MITQHKRFLIAALIASQAGAIGAPVTLRAQALTVDVTISSLTVVGDTTRITYQVTNHAESTDSLGKFVVEAPAGIKNIVRPTLGGRWMVGRQLVDMSAALWTPIGFRIAPSANTGPLTFEAVGIPGVVRAWAIGGVAAPDTIQDDTPPTPATPIQSRSAGPRPQTTSSP